MTKTTRSNVELIQNVKPKKPKIRKPPKRKNISQKIPNGTILQTRDEYFEGAGGYRKPGYESKGNYRKAVVVDSNKFDELAVVKLTTQKGYKIDNKSNFRPFIETKDNNLKPIRESGKFIKSNKMLSNKQVNKIKNISLTKPGVNIKTNNREKLIELKGRKK